MRSTARARLHHGPHMHHAVLTGRQALHDDTEGATCCRMDGWVLREATRAVRSCGTHLERAHVRQRRHHRRHQIVQRAQRAQALGVEPVEHRHQRGLGGVLAAAAGEGDVGVGDVQVGQARHLDLRARQGECAR